MSLIKDITKCSNKYQVIYADPPWSYRGQVQRGGADQTYSSSAAEYYSTLTIEQLCEMGPTIQRLADPEGCALYLWYSPPILLDAVRLMEAWGFRYATCAFVWVKKTEDEFVYDEETGNIREVVPGSLQVNPGHYTMSSCEMVNVGTLKRVPQPRGARNIRQVVFEPRTSHSSKPREIRHRINQMHPLQKKIELFSRVDQSQPMRGGFDDWGMDIGSVPWKP